MKLVIAHLHNDAFQSVRSELADLGVHTMTISEVHTSGPHKPMTLRYRGAVLQTQLRPCLKLECMTSDEDSPAVVNLLRGHTSAAGPAALRVAVLHLEDLYEATFKDDVYPEDPRLDAAVR